MPVARPAATIAAACVIAAWLGAPASAAAQKGVALIIAGASGGGKYAEQSKRWRQEIAAALTERYKFGTVTVLGDETSDDVPRASAAEVRKAITAVKAQVGKDDLLFLVLLGHGTFDGEVAKFNLVGPDLVAADWKSLLGGVAGTLAIVNTTESSYPFLEELAASGRIVITATDSVAQKYATVFPEYFAKALSEASTDLDKNGRTSVWEVFQASALAVKQHYSQRAQLTTERAVLDDTGEGKGREFDAKDAGRFGSLARATYLEAMDPAEAANPALADLVRRRRVLEADAEALRARKPDADPAKWSAEWETLMIDLARVSREIRSKS